MSDDVDPYPTLKPSRVEWLGDVPEHWDVPRLKEVVSRVDDKGVATREDRPYIGLEAIESRTGKLLPDRVAYGVHGLSSRFESCDTLYGKLRPYLAKACNPGRAGYCSSELLVLRPTHRIASRFLLYSVLVPGFVDEVNSSTTGARMPRADWRWIGSRRVPLPDLIEQRAIISYLDRETAKIDALIGRNETLVERLREQHAATISQTVTRGLPPDECRKAGINPHPKLKPSGVEWLGDVPAHWEIKSIKCLADIRVSNVDKHVRQHEMPVRLCNYTDVYYRDNIDHSFDGSIGSATLRQIERCQIKNGDVLITKDSETWNDIGVPSLAVKPAVNIVCGYHLALLRPKKEELSGAYLYWVLRDRLIACQMHVEAKGVTRYGLSLLAIKSVQVPVPTVREQRAIATFLEGEAAKFGRAIELAHREIQLLQAYRTRLISDVVTGEVDVRNVLDRNVRAGA